MYVGTVSKKVSTSRMYVCVVTSVTAVRSLLTSSLCRLADPSSPSSSSFTEDSRPISSCRERERFEMADSSCLKAFCISLGCEEDEKMVSLAILHTYIMIIVNCGSSVIVVLVVVGEVVAVAVKLVKVMVEMTVVV